MANTLAQEIAAAKAAATKAAAKPKASVVTPAQEVATAKAAAGKATTKAPAQPKVVAPNPAPTPKPAAKSPAPVRPPVEDSVIADMPSSTFSTFTTPTGTTITAPTDMFGGASTSVTPEAGSSTNTADQGMSAERRDAFKLIEDAFKGYGLEELIPEIRKYMVGYVDEKGNKIMVGPNEAEILLKETRAYKNRFLGNETRLKNGLNVLSPGDYIRAENEFADLFKQYGQTSFANQAEYADLIGNAISNVELNKRLQLATDAWTNADPNVKAMMKKYYPSITDADAIGYFLKPETKLPELQTKVAAAEIGGEALRQGLPTDIASAEEFAKAGIGVEQARAGYQSVAEVLPTASKLSQVYGEANIPYTQRTAEEEYLLNQQSAAEKRRRLQSLERAKFSGSSGINENISIFASKGSRGSF